MASKKTAGEAALVAALRQCVLAVSPAISEGVKWNAPSFRTEEWFLTLQARPRGKLLVVFHCGAKVKDGTADLKQRIPDPTGLLEWRASDRATVEFTDVQSFTPHARALGALVRAWIKVAL
jgi:hypothetical protein